MGSSPFLNEIRTSIKLRGMSLRTEKTYIYWIRDFIRFHNRKHPNIMGAAEVMTYLGYLSARRNVAINTQRVALNALAYLYNQFLQQPLGDLDFTFASKPRRLPEVLSSFEVASLLREMSAGRDKLIFSLLFGSGLRITECLRLRVKDFDFINGTVSRHGCLFFHQAGYAIIQSLVRSVATICMTLFHEKYSSRQSLIVVCCTNVLLATHLDIALQRSYCVTDGI